ncbi:hypothetical protein [Lentzea miocenica]|nr:hypothetical protein [Lentzea sp. BCCO 10_0856]
MGRRNPAAMPVGKAAEPPRQSSAVPSKSAVTMLVLVGSCWPAWLYEQARRLR